MEDGSILEGYFIKCRQEFVDLLLTQVIRTGGYQETDLHVKNTCEFTRSLETVSD